MIVPTGWKPPKELGGRLCVDFANTLDRDFKEGAVVGTRDDKLSEGYRSLVAWAWRRRVITESLADALMRAASARPDQAEAVHARAIRLRTALLVLFDAAADGRIIAKALIASVNAELDETMIRPLVVDGQAFRQDLDKTALDAPIAPVLLSAVSLIAEGELGAVGRCGGHCCGWLFLDTSRSKSRRWCSTTLCGNRTRARRHYARAKADAA